MSEGLSGENARLDAIDSIAVGREVAPRIDLPGAKTEPEAVPEAVIAQWVETDKQVLEKRKRIAAVPLIFMKDQ